MLNKCEENKVVTNCIYLCTKKVTNALKITFSVGIMKEFRDIGKLVLSATAKLLYCEIQHRPMA
jgi:hypothetical protein